MTMSAGSLLIGSAVGKALQINAHYFPIGAGPTITLLDGSVHLLSENIPVCPLEEVEVRVSYFKGENDPWIAVKLPREFVILLQPMGDIL